MVRFSSFSRAGQRIPSPSIHGRSDLGPTATRVLLACVLAGLMAVSPGCVLAGWMADIATPDARKKVQARYPGLAGKRVAVLVAAGDEIEARFPHADRNVIRAVVAQLAQDVPEIQLVEPDQLIAFQEAQPAWNTLPYDDLLYRLHVDRLLYINLSQYTTRANGDPHLWRGSVVANVGVTEAEAADQDVLVFNEVLSVHYPGHTRVGVVNSDDDTIELGMLEVFSRRVSQLFHDHTVVQSLR